MPLPQIASVVLGLIYLIITILIICAILRIFAIHGELKKHSKILKKQNELLKNIIEAISIADSNQREEFESSQPES